MRNAATLLPEIRRGALRIRAIVWVVLLAFTLQSYIAQTHIHGVSQDPNAPAIAKVLANGPAGTKSPLNNNPVDCPYCQAVTHGGVFLVAAVPLLFLPVSWVDRVTLPGVARDLAAAPTHNWQSRGPPER